MTVLDSHAVAEIAAVWTPPDELDEFRIVRLLGSGAMGQVYLAHDSLLDRPVALKFLHAAKDPAARAQVIDEARAIARLQHPNVVAIYRVAEVAGRPYLVSEYVHGHPLHELPRPMPWHQVLDIALDLTRGLAAAHRRGVLHRDVKTANAVLTDDGCAKLLDFGLASVSDISANGATAEPSAPGERAAVRARRSHTPTLPGARAAGRVREPAADTCARGSGGLSGPRPRHAGTPMVGTPLYMAPEIWRGESATRRSDLYSLGILLYELLSGSAPHRAVDLSMLAHVVQNQDIAPLGEMVVDIPPAFAAIIDRLVQRDPGSRFASADALLVALEDSAAPVTLDGDPDGNPYRGLAVFESAHASMFFGRRGEIRELVGRVRTEAFVVVGGDSGTGKSSLCRAGALPWLAAHDGWSCVEVVPGRHPVKALAAELAAWLGTRESALASSLRDGADAIARTIRQRIADDKIRPARRLLLFVDQLEELLTLADPEEARTAAAILAALSVHTSSIRVLATARSDFLSRLAMLPGLGNEMAAGLYFLRPLTGDHIREVIVRPAAAKGVVYESEALIDTLVEQTEHAPGGLPLLQFALAELWDARDVKARTIRAAALGALGGVGGALTRHADRVLAGLGSSERDAARRILLRLVTVEGTRRRRSEAELVREGAGRNSELAALEALVRGRVLVANNAHDGGYEIAHEALLAGWSTLQGWLQRDAVDHALRDRVEQAAIAWQRMNRARDLLWGRRQLAETRSLDRDSLAPRDAAFLAASARAARRRRILALGATAAIVIAAVIAGLVIRTRAQRQLDAVVADQLGATTTAQLEARQLAGQRDVVEARAFNLFDTQRWTEGEAAWTEVEALTAREEAEYRRAAGHLESALLLDPLRIDLRGWFADLTFERLLRAEHDRHRDLVEELAARMDAYDDGEHRMVLGADTRVELTIEPAATRVWIERSDARQLIGEAPLPALTLAPGYAVFVLEAAGRVAARLPVVLARGKTLSLRVVLPSAGTAPPAMIFVPPGPFLFGSADSSDLRRGFLGTAPLHEVSTAGYFIGRYEVTFAEWIEFLDDLAPAERLRRAPRAVGAVGLESSVMLTEIGPRRWRLSLTPTTRTYTAETGHRLHYEDREARADQDWMKLPVSGVSYEDAGVFAAWLDRTGRMPGARLCNEYEWERAARGADARTFPSGATLAPDDANIDVTYGRAPLAFGPDEVGSHPRSRSPVGADDMAGNVWEWTSSVEAPDSPITRGGGWYQGELSARSMNRAQSEPTQRHPFIGVRLCATPR